MDACAQLRATEMLAISAIKWQRTPCHEWRLRRLLPAETTQSVRATEQLSGSIHEIGQQASRSLNMARSAVGDAERTNQTIRSLAEAAERAPDRNKW